MKPLPPCDDCSRSRSAFTFKAQGAASWPAASRDVSRRDPRHALRPRWRSRSSPARSRRARPVRGCRVPVGSSRELRVCSLRLRAPLTAWRYVDIDGWFQAPPLEAFGHAFYKLIEERTVGRARADHIHLNDPAGEVFGATREANSEVNIARREPLLRINLDVERSCSLVRSLNPSNHLGSP